MCDPPRPFTPTTATRSFSPFVVVPSSAANALVELDKLRAAVANIDFSRNSRREKFVMTAILMVTAMIVVELKLINRHTV